MTLLTAMWRWPMLWAEGRCTARMNGLAWLFENGCSNKADCNSVADAATAKSMLHLHPAASTCMQAHLPCMHPHPVVFWFDSGPALARLALCGLVVGLSTLFYLACTRIQARPCACKRIHLACSHVQPCSSLMVVRWTSFATHGQAKLCHPAPCRRMLVLHPTCTCTTCRCIHPVWQSYRGNFKKIKANHLEERLLDQAQARASYTPLFWGHSRSIPQGMILDVQPLVKSLFCPIRASPNGFFDFEASTP